VWGVVCGGVACGVGGCVGCGGSVVLVALEAGTEDGGRKGKAGRRGLLVLQLLSDDYTIVYEDTKLM
jgi:hypothetical protein